MTSRCSDRVPISHAAPMHPSNRKVIPEKVAKPRASKVKNDRATVTTDTARHCRRSRVFSSAQDRRAVRAR